MVTFKLTEGKRKFEEKRNLLKQSVRKFFKEECVEERNFRMSRKIKKLKKYGGLVKRKEGI